VVTFNRAYKVVSVYDETDQDEQEAAESAEFDSSQYIYDVAAWSGLSLLIGIAIGIIIGVFAVCARTGL